MQFPFPVHVSGNKLRKISNTGIPLLSKTYPCLYVLANCPFIAVFTLPLSPWYFAFNRITESISTALNFEPLLFLYREFFFCRPNSESINSDLSSRGDFWFTIVLSYIDLRDFTVAVNQMASRNCLLKSTMCPTGFKCCYSEHLILLAVLHLVLWVTKNGIHHQCLHHRVKHQSCLSIAIRNCTQETRRSIPPLINGIDYVLMNGGIRVTLDTQQ
jgi:hypothetical protein